MNVTRENKALANDIIAIEIAAADYKAGFEKKLKKYSREMTVPGFRKGNVPVGMIKKMYGEAILADEINHLADHALNDFVKENSLKLLGRPILAEGQEELNLAPNEDKSYQIKFEIGYETNYTPALSGKTFDQYEIAVTSEMVDKEVENVFGYFTKLEDSTEPIEKGDTIYFNLSNSNGFHTESFASTDEISDSGFEALNGKKADDEITIKLANFFNNEKLNIKRYVLNLKEDADMSEEDYNGEFLLKINSTKKKTKPTELSAEQIQMITRDEKKTTMEELCIALEDDIKKQYENVSRNFLRNDVYEHVATNTKMDLPVEFLKKWIASEKENNLTPESVEKDFPNIEKSIKWDLITTKYALDHNIKVEAEEVKMDFKARYMSYFANSGYTPPMEQLEKFAADAMKDEKNVRRTFEGLLDAKVLDKMIEEIATKKISYTEEQFTEESKKRSEKNSHSHDHDTHDHKH